MGRYFKNRYLNLTKMSHIRGNCKSGLWQTVSLFCILRLQNKTMSGTQKDRRQDGTGRMHMIGGNRTMALLEVTNVKKIYTTRFGGNQVQALKNVTFSVEAGEFVAIMGESGSGKTTLLNILASLDRPTEGEVLLEGKSIVRLTEKEISAFRRKNLGFVFQDFNLLDTFSLRDNIYLPLVLAGEDYREMEQKIRPIAKALRITDILDKYPYEVSGGQKQRAAVARALITSPRLVLADEPTGALDSRAASALLSMFEEINQEGQTILMVTHSAQAASHASRVLFIKDGEVFHQIYRGTKTTQEMYQMISDTLTILMTGGETYA